MKYLILIAIAFTLSACTDDEMNSTFRAAGAAYEGYYGRPAYYGQPTTSTTVVTPAAPVYPVTY